MKMVLIGIALAGVVVIGLGVIGAIQVVRAMNSLYGVDNEYL